MIPTPWSRAMARYGSKYERSVSRPSASRSRVKDAKLGSSRPRWKISVVSIPPSVT
jgi:hypothetical protein